MDEGDQLAGAAAGVSPSAHAVLVSAFLGGWLSRREFRDHHRRDDQGVHR